MKKIILILAFIAAGCGVTVEPPQSIGQDATGAELWRANTIIQVPEGDWEAWSPVLEEGTQFESPFCEPTNQETYAVFSGNTQIASTASLALTFNPEGSIIQEDGSCNAILAIVGKFDAISDEYRIVNDKNTWEISDEDFFSNELAVTEAQ